MIQQNKFTVSNVLIAVSILFTWMSLVLNIIPTLWLSNYYIDNWNYIFWFITLFTSQFLHGWWMHLLFNSVFIYYFGNIVEVILGRNKMILFFIFSAITTWIAVTFLSDWVTIWISWFAMALLSFYTLQLWSKNNPEYKWWITAMVLNIVIGFAPWISFVGHFFWIISWVLYWGILKFTKYWLR